MTTEALPHLETVAAIRLEALFAEIRKEVSDYAHTKDRPFQLILDAKFTASGRLVGDAIVDLKYRFDTQAQ